MDVHQGFLKIWPTGRSPFSRKTAAFLTIASLLTGCEAETLSTTRPCVPDLSSTGAGASGQGYIFNPDPISESGITTLAPTSMLLDTYRRLVALTNLSGLGVLDGDFVSVKDGQACDEDYGSYSETQDFLYSQSESGFQETNAYYAGNKFRAALDAADELVPNGSLRIIANCMDEDNAYYVRLISQPSGNISGKVCLGNSVDTFGAYYADDAQVVVHELQHGTTVDSYSLSTFLNSLWYDEAGALNEGISDFMALIDSEPDVNPILDTRVFSRWALGTFTPGYSSSRGAHRCPEYDADYPDCASYGSASGGGFSVNGANHVSFIYPDGVGWPFGNNFTSPNFVRSAHLTFSSKEQIHNAATIVSGMLWDIYQELKTNRAGDGEAAKLVSMKLVVEAIKLLPKPTGTNVAPVTVISFANQIRTVAAALQTAAVLTANDVTDIDQMLTERGVYGYTPLAVSWAEVGPGNAGVTAGLRVIDSPTTLKNWAAAMGASQSVITQSGVNSTNGRVNRGEVVAIWFDVKIAAGGATSAGGIRVDAQSPTSGITFLDWDYNLGSISSSRTQIMYQKVYGESAVAALNNGTAGQDTNATQTYFGTNPQYASSYRTAIWMRASSSMSTGTYNLQVTLYPANGPAQVVSFPVTIY